MIKSALLYMKKFRLLNLILFNIGFFCLFFASSASAALTANGCVTNDMLFGIQCNSPDSFCNLNAVNPGDRCTVESVSSCPTIANQLSNVFSCNSNSCDLTCLGTATKCGNTCIAKLTGCATMNCSDTTKCATCNTNYSLCNLTTGNGTCIDNTTNKCATYVGTCSSSNSSGYCASCLSGYTRCADSGDSDYNKCFVNSSCSSGYVYNYCTQSCVLNQTTLKLGFDSVSGATSVIQSSVANASIFTDYLKNVSIGSSATTKPFNVSSYSNFENIAYGVTPFSTDLMALATVEYVTAALATTTQIISGSNPWTLSGNNLFASSTSWNVGIGTSTSVAKLQINTTTGGADALILKTNTQNNGYRFYFSNPIGGGSDLNIESQNGDGRIKLKAYQLELSGLTAGISGLSTLTVGNGVLFGGSSHQITRNGAELRFIANNSGGANPFFSWVNNTGTEKMRLDAHGYLGISSSSPSRLLSFKTDTGTSINLGGAKIENLKAPESNDEAVNLAFLNGLLEETVTEISSSTISVGKFVGVTDNTYTGDNNGNPGYAYAHNQCKNGAGPLYGSHVCSAAEILNSIASSSTVPVDVVWIFNGPPGFTASANDCNARRVAVEIIGVNKQYGTYWEGTGLGSENGSGFLGYCTLSLKFACCK